MATILQSEVFEIIAQIPYGKVCTYKQIANMAKTGPRVVGNILHQNKNPQKYPCHRVVKTNGTLASGYLYGGKNGQRLKLEKEGIKFKGDKIDLENYLFSF